MLEELFNYIRSIFGSIPRPARKVLVLEGGGMRGVFTTGVLQAFHEHNHFPWKLILGTSAGALNGVAYVTGQIHLARDAFFTKLLEGDVIRRVNMLRFEKHVMDFEGVIKTIFSGDEPLKMHALKKACPVLITATNCRPGDKPETVYFDSRRDDVITALNATSAIPYLYRGFVQHKEYKLLDGAVLDPVPFQKALSLGYEQQDILVVATRKKGFRKKGPSFWIKTLYEQYYKLPEHSQLLQALLHQDSLYNSVYDELEQKYAGIHVIYPPESFQVERTTQDSRKILDGFELGIQAAKVFLACCAEPSAKTTTGQ